MQHKGSNLIQIGVGFNQVAYGLTAFSWVNTIFYWIGVRIDPISDELIVHLVQDFFSIFNFYWNILMMRHFRRTFEEVTIVGNEVENRYFMIYI